LLASLIFLLVVSTLLITVIVLAPVIAVEDPARRNFGTSVAKLIDGSVGELSSGDLVFEKD